MSVPIRLDRDGLHIDVGFVMGGLSDETKSHLAMYLLTDDRLIQAVVEQMVDGITYDDAGLWWSMSAEAIGRLRERLCEKLPEIAARAVKTLIHDRNAALAAAKQEWDWAWRLWHAWPEEHWRDRPEHPKYESTSFPGDDVVSKVLNVEGERQ